MDENPSTMGMPIPPHTNTRNPQRFEQEWHDNNRRAKENNRKRIFIDLLGGTRAFDYSLENFPCKNIPAYQSALRFDPLLDNFYFWGPSWCGKTHLADALAHKFWDVGQTVYMASIFDFKSTIRRLDSEYRFSEKAQYLDRIANADMLVLHELGRGAVSESGQEAFWNILDRRVMAEKNGLITTSNYSLPKIRDTYGASIVARLEDLCGTKGVIQFPPRGLEVL